MNINRRDFIGLAVASAGAIALPSCHGHLPFVNSQTTGSIQGKTLVPFQPLAGPIPLGTEVQFDPNQTLVEISYKTTQQQIQAYETYEIIDDLVLPEGFTYDVIAAWGDPVGNGHFGYNNDYLSFIPTGENEGLLTINFEYISPRTWLSAYKQIIGQDLPIAQLEKQLKSLGKTKVNAFALPAQSALRKTILELSQAGLSDLGIGVISIRQNSDAQWERTYSNLDRRITGLSGWMDGRYLQSTGPGVAVFRKKGQGYDDRLGDRIIGTFGNCAGGTTPWGTVLSAEENFQTYVPESVYPDGTAVNPSVKPFSTKLGGMGNVFGLAGNKYGWIVEVDPANPEDYGTKHTWLGRYRHEAVGIRVEAGKPLAFYSGCDRRGGHLYKFVSKDKVKDPQDKANSALLENGILYAAQFNPDGTGTWIPLTPKTPVNPNLPSTHVGGMICLPKRPEGGTIAVSDDREIETYRASFKTLADLYTGTPEEIQGAILIDAHLAASAVGATCTARPEDTDVAADGSLFIAFTSGFASGETGGPDQQIFSGPDGTTPYESGWIMRLVENRNQPNAKKFRWQMFATGGEVADGGVGFSNPDNLEFDAQGNLWMVTDISTSMHNQSVSMERMNESGEAMNSKEILGIYGNNSLWFFPTTGEAAGTAHLFATGPVECELCGPFFTPDQQTLFVAAQHPGEANGMRQNSQSETRQFALTTTTGERFIQTRQVPLGSNWPGKQPNDPPIPAVVAIRRLNSKQII
ncbi:MAG: alkaline phosphatase PhoX [Microcoleaceae cyanobacterium]